MLTTTKLPPYARYVVHAVAWRRRVRVQDIMSAKKAVPIAWARYEIWSILYRDGRAGLGRNSNPYSLPAIGRMFGRDHTSILMGLRRWNGVPTPSKYRGDPDYLDPEPKPEGCYLPLAPAPRPLVTKDEDLAHRLAQPAPGHGPRIWFRPVDDGRAGPGDRLV